MKNKVASSGHGEITLSQKDGVCVFSYGGRRTDLKLILIILWCFCIFTAQASFAQNLTSPNSNKNISKLLLDNIGLVDRKIDNKNSLSDSSFQTPADYKDGFEFTEQSNALSNTVKSTVNKIPTLPSEKINFIERPQDDELIVQVMFNNFILDSAIISYFDGEQLFVPLSVLTELLGFPIHVDPSHGTAEGWFIREGNKFSLSSPYSMISIADKTSPVKGGAVEPHIDDIYVSIDMLSKWFPLKLNFNFNELRLRITPLEKLPFMEEAERKARWEQANKKKKSAAKLKEENKGPIVKLPHHMISAPVVQMSNGDLYSRTANGVNIISSHSIQAQNDLFGMDMRSSFNIITQKVPALTEISDISLELSKEDLEGNIGGRLKATKLHMGDITGVSVPLAGGAQGRGVSITNEPLNFVSDISDFKIDGFGPAGWDVELYQDQSLLDFKVIDNSGKYKFQNLQLRSGFNLLRIVVYGPNGEKRERFEKFFIGSNMIPKGKFIYNASAIQSSSPLIDLSKNKKKTTAQTLSFLGEYGFNKDLSANVGFYNGIIFNKQTSAITLGIRKSNSRSFTQGNYMLTREGGYSARINSTGTVGKDIRWSAGYSMNKGYSGISVPEKYSAFISFDKPFSLKLLPSGSYGLTAKEIVLNNGTKTRTYKNRLSLSLFGISVLNNLKYTHQVNSSTKDDFTGDLTATGKSALGQIRGRANYNFKDKKHLIESASATLSKTLSEKLSINGGVSANFINGLSYKIDAGFSLKLKKVKIGANAKISDTGDYSLGVNMAYNFVPKSIYGDYTIASTSRSSGAGDIIIRPFLDLNNNNHMDKDEKAISGIVFRNERTGETAISGKDGTAILGGLAPNVINKIALNSKSISDIYTIPKFEYFNVLGKAGINGVLIFPLVSLGEISGIIGYIDKNDQFIELKDTPIILLDKDKKVVAEVDSEYDGFYLFPSLPMGEYEMFFPKSTKLNSMYFGSGNGPKFTLSSEEPEKQDADILVTSEDILFRKLQN